MTILELRKIVHSRLYRRERLIRAAIKAGLWTVAILYGAFAIWMLRFTLGLQ